MWSGASLMGSSQAGGSSASRKGAEYAVTPTQPQWKEVREESHEASAVDMVCKNRLTFACCSGAVESADDADANHLQIEFASLTQGKIATDANGSAEGGPSASQPQRPAQTFASSSSRWWNSIRQQLTGWTVMCGNGLPTGVDQSCEAIEAEHPAWRDSTPWRKSTVNGRDCMLCGTYPMHDCSDEEVVKKEMILVKAKGTLRDGEQVFTDGDDMRQIF
mmetsp:Transcript_56534/g.104662  ORF Transcript_56534/g.104662 Transcript_56534/m.104662 type:complete len:219 (+) Transcript_56534:147-803(+)